MPSFLSEAFKKEKIGILKDKQEAELCCRCKGTWELGEGAREYEKRSAEENTPHLILASTKHTNAVKNQIQKVYLGFCLLLVDGGGT